MAELETSTKTNIILGFPGVGATAEALAARGRPTTYMLTTDIDDAQFKDGWPLSYVDYIVDTAENHDGFIFASHNKQIRAELERRRIPFYLVYPTVDQLRVYVDRCRASEHGAKFADNLDYNWYYIHGLYVGQKGCTHIVLEPGQFMAHAMERIRQIQMENQ